eukprot:scaffold244699_cov32-Tisochrysis_lutea.AAC.2
MCTFGLCSGALLTVSYLTGGDESASVSRKTGARAPCRKMTTAAKTRGALGSASAGAMLTKLAANGSSATRRHAPPRTPSLESMADTSSRPRAPAITRSSARPLLSFINYY